MKKKGKEKTAKPKGEKKGEEKIEEEIVKAEEITEEEKTEEIKKVSIDIEAWKPKTSLGQQVKSGKIKQIDEILEKGMKIMEPQIVDILLPNLEVALLLIGQSKGKFGGGQRRVFKQTQKKTREGNKPRFSTIAVVGNNNGHLG